MKDKDGFHILVRKPVEKSDDTNKVIKAPAPKLKVYEKKRKISIKKKNPFKKGSWKHQFWKNLREYVSGRFIRNFHNINFRNFIIWRKYEDSDYQVSMEQRSLDAGFVKELKDSDRANIMISVGDRMYASVSAKAYRKLMKVDKIAIHLKLTGWYDGDDESTTIYEDYTTIDNINDLLSYVNYYRQCIYGVFDIQAKCCWYTSFVPEFKILVTFRNGDCKTYKGDMNEFMKDFDLYQF